ncbi:MULTISPECIES: S24 family peptidase [Pseudomonas]|uniref:LexA family transcriptional regulator n=1 Tax=Pseudomonas TaxID=286 RepID=UPI0021571879|nr:MULTISPECIES: S24 family peptidase [Pseudomonas]MDN6874116.1 S24 family peptidase [Pseudomonas citronellolis]WRT83496.1 S24 family peptidase [Pseudomonas citronellolis]
MKTSGERLRDELDSRGIAYADFARDMGTDSQNTHNWFKRGVPKGKLLKVAASLGVRPEWLDSGEEPKSLLAQVDMASLPAPLAQKISSYRSKVSIDRFDVAGSMGPGTEPPDLHNIVDSMTLDAAWVRQNLVYTAVENIKLISGRGDSMSPTIKNGDPLLVDVGITSVECDAIYFFLMGRQLQIKRIQRHLDGLTILSDNDRYKPVEIAAEREEELTIFAQVIYGWNGQKF